MATGFKTIDLLEALRKRHEGEAWAFMTEVPDATGMNHRRWADAVAMSLWPSRGLSLHGFEIKASRTDWQKELAQPAKAESVCRFCDYWWIVAADAKIVRREELPETWGLLLPDSKGVLKAAVQAPKLKPVEIDRHFLCGLLRAATKPGNRATNETKLAEYSRGYNQAKEESQRQVDQAKKERDEIRNHVREFEAASGVSVSGNWRHSSRDVGRIVYDILQGKYDRDRDDMANIRRIAAGIVERIDGELQARLPEAKSA